MLQDRHIEYLKLVESKQVTLWWNTSRTMSRYVYIEWGDRKSEIDQTVASQMHALGLTHIVFENQTQRVKLTPRGERILLDEAEAWT